MDMNNPIGIYVILGVVFVAIFIVLFAINQALKSGNRRPRRIQVIRKQPRCLNIFKTHF